MISTAGFFAENDPSEKHPTFVVRPGESIRVTLRVVWNECDHCQPFCEPGFVFRPRRRSGPRRRRRIPASSNREEDVVGNFADLTVDGTLAAPPVAGMGGFVDMPQTTIRNVATATAEPDGTFRWDYYRSTRPGDRRWKQDNDAPFGVGDSADDSWCRTAASRLVRGVS